MCSWVFVLSCLYFQAAVESHFNIRMTFDKFMWQQKDIPTWHKIKFWIVTTFLCLLRSVCLWSSNWNSLLNAELMYWQHYPWDKKKHCLENILEFWKQLEMKHVLGQQTPHKCNVPIIIRLCEEEQQHKIGVGGS